MEKNIDIKKPENKIDKIKGLLKWVEDTLKSKTSSGKIKDSIKKELIQKMNELDAFFSETKNNVSNSLKTRYDNLFEHPFFVELLEKSNKIQAKVEEASFDKLIEERRKDIENLKNEFIKTKNSLNYNFKKRLEFIKNEIVTMEKRFGNEDAKAKKLKELKTKFNEVDYFSSPKLNKKERK